MAMVVATYLPETLVRVCLHADLHLVWSGRWPAAALTYVNQAAVALLKVLPEIRVSTADCAQHGCGETLLAQQAKQQNLLNSCCRDLPLSKAASCHAGDAPWAGPNSIAALMQEADRQIKQTLPPAPVRPAAAPAEPREASKKEKKAKKEKVGRRCIITSHEAPSGCKLDL